MSEQQSTRLCECGCGHPTPIASMTSAQKGHVKGQPIRFIHGHSGGQTTNLRTRVENRGYSSPCWVWQGARDNDGYGRLRYQGKRYLAHRFVYKANGFDIPKGYVLDHLCGTRACLNPEHLEPVSHADNSRRKSRLTAADIDDIQTSEESGVALAAKYGISPSYVCQIRKRR